ncbi:putative Ig domain-containing protein [Sediminicola luteus]|uniref:Uncharacterized protein n=1 Tax=Sediminicola luteus TaxID=319238 RepID=A0A2A4GDH2_9FLAO|nr:putative Ig domain-containing protein [Sediminicola luteus]PCE65802.1 hypothetical protein B7P33_00400 [Sediminicola luteus]
MKTVQNLLLIGTVILLLTSCSKDDDGPKFEAPEFSYSETTVPILFSTSGSLSAPNVNWNNAPGAFSISPSIIGLSINAQTGTLSWDRSLPPGTHQIVVTATNQAGSQDQQISLENPFHGIFTGSYVGSSGNTWFYELEFDANGGMLTREDDENDPTLGTGTYTLSQNTILANYTYDVGGSEYSLKLDLNQTTNMAELDGAWYYNFDAEESELGGTVLVTME